VRSLSDWKEDSICSLLALLAGKEVLPQGNDAIGWPLNSKGSFSAKSFCSAQVELTDCFNVAAMSFCNFTEKKNLTSAASKGKIPTEDKLKRRNFSGPSRCFLCLDEEESVDHLLVHYRWVYSLGIHLSL